MRHLEEIEDEVLERILDVGEMRSKFGILVVVCRLDIYSTFVFFVKSLVYTEDRAKMDFPFLFGTSGFPPIRRP